MGSMDGWDLILLVVAVYLAIVSLVRLMTRHRNRVVEQLHRQAEIEKRKQAEARVSRAASADGVVVRPEAPGLKP